MKAKNYEYLPIVEDKIGITELRRWRIIEGVFFLNQLIIFTRS